MRLVLLLLSVAVCCGCANPMGATGPRVVRIAEVFDEGQALAQLRPGTGGIRGNALLRQQGGGVVTCAGAEVLLVPATPYAAARMMAIYGSSEHGYLGAYGRETAFDPDPPAFAANTRRTKCDAQGTFTFERLTAGDFYVVAVVLWQVGYNRQGGALMQRFSVREGELTSLVMSP